MNYQDKVYGDVEISEEVLLDIINSQALQRLKHINQYGTWVLVNPKYNTTRFEHSVGVMILLKKLGADIKEQAAGLIHDVAHTAFSHVVDYVFGKIQAQDYHEQNAEDYVSRTDLPEILGHHGYDWREVLDEERFSLLEKPQPATCADRLDYFLRDCLTYGLFDKDYADQVLANIKVKGVDIYYDVIDIARSAAAYHLKICDLFWGCPLQAMLFHLLSEAIKVGLDKGIFNEKDLWGTDNELMQKLRDSNNSKINELLEMINPDIRVELVEKDWDYHLFTKARYSDPLVQVNNELKSLSEIDQIFKEQVEDFISERKQGYKIKLITK